MGSEMCIRDRNGIEDLAAAGALVAGGDALGCVEWEGAFGGEAQQVADLVGLTGCEREAGGGASSI